MVAITDGDTVTVLRPDKTQVLVRLYGIDAPERRQSFGTAAKDYLGTVVHRQAVAVLVTDVDRYGRSVGLVLLSDGRVVNHAMVTAGLAWWYAAYAAKDAALARLEADARAQGVGLWAEAMPVPPWEFRK